MTRLEFMEELRSRLQTLPFTEQQDALRYYEEYFDDAGPDNEQKVVEELGTPEEVAKNCRLDNHTLQSGKEKRISFGERQQRGRMGKLLYFLFQTESCIWKSSKEKNLWDA